jgi:citrate lyase beta subunit
MFQKALSLPADGLILDLEDSVTIEKKAEARMTVTEWLKQLNFGQKERLVRINPLDSGYGEADLEATIQGKPDGYVIPKPRRAEDIQAVAAILDRLETLHGFPRESVALLAIATETPEGLLNIAGIAKASPRLAALSWGMEDLSAAMGISRTRTRGGELLDLFRYARMMTLLAAAAAVIDAIDTVFTDIHDLDRLRIESLEAGQMGFVGKLSIHPNQVDVINQAFSPSAAEVQEAEALIQAFEASRATGQGAFSFLGQMVDAPHLARAKKLLERARLAAGAPD